MRKKFLKNVKKIVVKIGTNSLFANEKNLENLQNLASDIASFTKKGFEFTIVSSGAVGFGMQKLNIKTRPSILSKNQALASLGQNILMQKWANLFEVHDIKVNQILLTYDIVQDRQKFISVRNCLNAAKNYNLLPIINENDSVATDELNFGDNDNLSVFTSLLIDADLLILLTDTDGIFDANPQKNQSAKRISLIENIDETLFSKVEDCKNRISKGGMRSKLNSAKLASDSGIPVIIANGISFSLKRILEGADIGSFILPCSKQKKEKRTWLLFNTKISGKIIVDKGAKDAIIKRHKSLLPSGIKKVEEEFVAGTVVGIFDEDNELFARGISCYSKSEIDKIKGQKTNLIKEILKDKKTYDEVIDRNNMIIVYENLE